MLSRILALFGVLALAQFAAAQDAKTEVKLEPKAETKAETKRPEVEVVFCLDTTGSMGGLINAAKQKIWAISNQIASGTPTPRLKVGLVAYRDIKDAYVTKIFDLSDDLDAIHANLQGFQAQGGGDFPESVNQALNEAVTKIKWSKDKNTLKLVFLVGDAPPHMNYKDDVKYQDTCKEAVKNNIIINTVQCGTNADTKKFWQEICSLAEGSYVQIEQSGGPIVAIATPFDKDLAEANREIAKQTLVFGARDRQEAAREADKAAGKLDAEAAGARAAFLARNGGAAAYDLLQQVNDGKVKLGELKKEELPQEMQKMTLEEQKAHLEKIEKSRKELQAKILDLDQKRNKFIAEEQAKNAKNRAADSFDQNVLRILQRQAVRNNIQYAVPEPKAEEKK